MKMALLTKTILLLQSYIFWKITVNIVAILRYSIIVWQSFVTVDVSVFIKMKKKSNIVTMTKIYELRFELVDHSSYSANLVSNDFFLFSRSSLAWRTEIFIKQKHWHRLTQMNVKPQLIQNSYNFHRHFSIHIRL